MANKKGTGLSMVFGDATPEIEEEYNRWYNEEHAPDRVGVKGILSVARYQALRGSPKYITMMEMETADVVEQPHFQELQQNPTEWTKKMTTRGNGVTFNRIIGEQIYPTQVTQDFVQSDMAPVLQIGRMDVPPEVEDEWNQWYSGMFVPDFEKVPGCVRGRRFRIVRGEPRYAVVYEFEHENVSQRPEWAAARDSRPQSVAMRGHITHAPGSPGVYRKIAQFYSPR